MKNAQELTRTPSVGLSVDTTPIANVAGGTELIQTLGHCLSKIAISNGNDSGRVTIYANFEHVSSATTVIEADIMHKIRCRRSIVGGIAGEATDVSPDVFWEFGTHHLQKWRNYASSEEEHISSASA